MDKAEFVDILWNGDIHYDPSRTSGFARFLNRIGLESLWEHFPIHTDVKSTSTLEHFIVNKRLVNSIIDCGLMHLEFSVQAFFKLIQEDSSLFMKMSTSFKEKLYLLSSPSMLDRLSDVMTIKAVVTYKLNKGNRRK